jgi:hypothetical protein
MSYDKEKKLNINKVISQEKGKWDLENPWYFISLLLICVHTDT